MWPTAPKPRQAYRSAPMDCELAAPSMRPEDNVGIGDKRAPSAADVEHRRSTGDYALAVAGRISLSAHTGGSYAALHRGRCINLPWAAYLSGFLKSRLICFNDTDWAGSSALP